MYSKIPGRVSPVLTMQVEDALAQAHERSQLGDGSGGAAGARPGTKRAASFSRQPEERFEVPCPSLPACLPACPRACTAERLRTLRIACCMVV